MSVARPEYQRASHVVHPGIRGFLDHQPEEAGGRDEIPVGAAAALLGEPLALTAKTLTAFTGGLVDLSSAASDLVLIGAITHLRDEGLATIYPEGGNEEDSNPPR